MKLKRIVLAVTLPLAFTLGILMLLDISPPIGQAGEATPTTIYVAPSCTGVPTPCYTTLQAGVDAATGGELIMVATGVYTGTGESIVTVNKTLTIQGGYNATFTYWDPTALPSTLDGERARRAIRIFSGYSPSLEGLHIINGLDSSIYSSGADPTIRSCSIFNSSAMNGGSIYINDCNGCRIVGNRIFSSTASVDGAGIYLSNSTDAVLSDNHIYSTTAGRNGGGVSLSGCSNTSLLRNHIYSSRVGLSVNYGGGIYMDSSDHITLQNNIVYTNSAYVGGGIAIRDSDSFRLLGNEVYNNLSIASGAGIFAYNSNKGLIESNVIHGNVAQDDYENYGGGGIKLSTVTNTILVNNIVWGNYSGGTGSGIFLNSSEAHLLHNTLVANTGGDGHGVFVYSSTLWMTNTIVANHQRGIETDEGGTASLHHTLWPLGAWSNTTPTLGSSIVQVAGLAGFPRFLDPNAGNFHISRGSAAIDTGLSTWLSADIDGHSRPIGQQPDIGADEFWGWVSLPLVLRKL
jgi:parallel beta-helix repeat protein